MLSFLTFPQISPLWAFLSLSSTLSFQFHSKFLEFQISEPQTTTFLPWKYHLETVDKRFYFFYFILRLLRGGSKFATKVKKRKSHFDWNIWIHWKPWKVLKNFPNSSLWSVLFQRPQAIKNIFCRQPLKDHILNTKTSSFKADIHFQAVSGYLMVILFWFFRIQHYHKIKCWPDL